MRLIRGHGGTDGFFHYSVKDAFVPPVFVGPSVCSPTVLLLISAVLVYNYSAFTCQTKKKNHLISCGFLLDYIRLPTILFPFFILLVLRFTLLKTILENKDRANVHASTRTRRSMSLDVKIWMFGLWSEMDGEILNKT